MVQLANRCTVNVRPQIIEYEPHNRWLVPARLVSMRDRWLLLCWCASCSSYLVIACFLAEMSVVLRCEELIEFLILQNAHPKRLLNESLHFCTTCHHISNFIPANFSNWWRILFSNLQASRYSNLKPSCWDIELTVYFFFPKFTCITPWKLLSRAIMS